MHPSIRLIAVAAVFLAVSCTGVPTNTEPVPPAVGHISGRLLLAIHGDSRPVAGRVTVAGASHTWHLDVGSNGAFDASLPHGEYVVTGQSPMFIVNGEEGECRSANSPTTIGGGRTTQVDVVCQGL